MFLNPSLDWNQTDHGEIQESDVHHIMALSLRYLCPKWVYFLGLGAISAATMSSSDSCILAAASLFTSNIYKSVIRPNASERELLWSVRIVIALVGVIGVIIAYFGNSIYFLIIVANEVPYLVIFPQLICLLYFNFTNTYGAITGYIVALFLRLGGGEPAFNLPGFIPYPGNYVDESGSIVNGFPLKTFVMLSDFLTVVAVSLLTRKLYQMGLISDRMDFAQCFHKKHKDQLEPEIELSDEVIEKRQRLLK